MAYEGFRSVPERLGFEDEDDIEETITRMPEVKSDEPEYTAYGAPNLLGNKDVRDYWLARFYWTFAALAMLWCACFIVQSVLYATTDHFDACVVITHDMPRANPTVLTEHVVGRPHIFYFTVIVAVVMFLLYTAFVFYTPMFRTWYFGYVIFDQATHKYIFSSFAWAFMTVVLAVVVGVSDIWTLLFAAASAVVAQASLGFMEFWNGHRFKYYDNLMDAVAQELNQPARWHYKHPRIWNMKPVVDWAPFMVAFLCYALNAALIIGNYSYGTTHSSPFPYWWVTGAVAVYIIMIFLCLVYMFGSWMHWPMFTWYAWMEFIHHWLLFFAFNIVTFLVLGGSGGNQYDAVRGCLYPAA